jgi:hypothetical protein
MMSQLVCLRNGRVVVPSLRLRMSNVYVGVKNSRSKHLNQSIENDDDDDALRFNQSGRFIRMNEKMAMISLGISAFIQWGASTLYAFHCEVHIRRVNDQNLLILYLGVDSYRLRMFCHSKSCQKIRRDI